MKKVLMIGLFLVWGSNLFGVTNRIFVPKDENYQKAIKFYNDKYYEKAVGYLSEYLQKRPDDNRAEEFLEIMYTKYHTFQMEYLKGKNFYNYKNYKKAKAQFDKAFNVGNSEKLQFYLSDVKKKIFVIENTFLESSIVDMGDSVIIKRKRQGILSNATIYLVHHDNLQLMNTIAYFNKNRVVVPDIEKLMEDNIFRKFEAKSESVKISKSAIYNNFLVVMYPHTEDEVKAQPIIKLVTKKSMLKNTLLLLEELNSVALLYPATNIVVYTPTMETQKIDIETDMTDVLLAMSITNTDMIADLYVKPVSKGRRGMGWLWLLLLLLPLLFIAKMIKDKIEREKKKQNLQLDVKSKKTEDEKVSMNSFLYSDSEEEKKSITTKAKPKTTTRKSSPKSQGKKTTVTKAKPKTTTRKSSPKSQGKKTSVTKTKPKTTSKQKNSRTTKGKNLKIILLFILPFLFISSTNIVQVLESYLDSEAVEYYSLYISTNSTYTPAYYGDISKFYAYEKGIEIRDYAEAHKFIELVVDNIKSIANTYYKMNDYEQYALTSFMVYYIGKDFQFFSKAVANLRKGRVEKIALGLLEDSKEMENSEAYLASLIRYTGYISLSSSLPSEAMTHLAQLFEKHKRDFSAIEAIYTTKRMNTIINHSELSPTEKTIYALVELDSSLSNFQNITVPTFKRQLVKYANENYRINLYNSLIGAGFDAYNEHHYRSARSCYALADGLFPYNIDKHIIQSNLMFIRSARTGRGRVVIITNERR